MRNSSAILLLSAFATALVLFGVVLWMVLDHGQASAPPPDRVAASHADQDLDPLERRRTTEIQRSAVERAIRPDGLIDMSIDRFRLRMGTFPHSLDDLHRQPENLQPDQQWDGPYINNQRLLLDPWDHPYLYQSPGVHNKASYDLWSAGADGTSGTADDIGNW